MIWQTARFRLDLSQPLVMGIVNVTPDSFSDGGQHASTQTALAHARRLADEGAHILDIGGESTRPGSLMPSVEQELARVLPVVQEVVRWGVPVSVDTSRPEVIRACLEAGADIINDVRALTWHGALQAVLDHGRVGLCLMHMRGDPHSMQAAPHYDDVVSEVQAFLAERLQVVLAHGVNGECIALDPGYGFGKTTTHNLSLLRQQGRLLGLGQPLLVGWSRKRSLGDVTGKPVDGRVAASVAAALAAVENGARIVRVHDVAATVDALKIWAAVGKGLMHMPTEKT